MITGTGQPILKLIDADGTTVILSRTFQYARVIEPDFPPDLFNFKTQDGYKTIFNRGWEPTVEIYWPVLSDAEFTDLVTMMKSQFDFDETEGATKFLELTFRADKPDEKIAGWIVNSLKVLNETYFLNHSAKINFEGRKRLQKTEFLV